MSKASDQAPVMGANGWGNAHMETQSNGQDAGPPAKLASATELTEAKAWLERLLGPQHAKLFALHLDVAPRERSFFQVEVHDATVHVTGSTTIEIATGVGWFLKYRCDSSITWPAVGGRQLNLTALREDSLRRMESMPPIHRTRQYQHSFYLNPCTLSYSMTYWDWERWEMEIDLMALNGINLVLAPLGQELVWVKVYEKLGLSPADLEDFFSGPSFFAWHRMGNIQGWPRPVGMSFMVKHHALQKRILFRLRALGIQPILPAFAGFIPRALLQKHPNLGHTNLAPWAGFTNQYSALALLDPASPMFQKIGAMFLEQLHQDFGRDRTGYYLADVWNEMRPNSSAPEYIQQISKPMYRSMVSVDSSAVWVMQAWLFLDVKYWQPPQIKALLQGAPQGRLLLLDLYAEVYAQWPRTEGFYGADFIWCMLHNFGGNNGMYGSLESVARGPLIAAQHTGAHMKGVGVTMEGIEQNPIVYDLALEMAFRDQPPNTADWVLAYARRRYAGVRSEEVEQAWAILGGTVYSCTDLHINHNMDIPNSRPALRHGEAPGWGLQPWLWYDLEKVTLAWQHLLHAGLKLGTPLSSCSAFQYDLIDVSREVLCKLATGHWRHVVLRFMSGDAEGLRQSGNELLLLLDHLDHLLAHHQGFMLGPHLQQARSFADSTEEADEYEYNARLLLTLWGTSHSGDSEVCDYANRHWSGLVSSFYRHRWSCWLARLMAAVQPPGPGDAGSDTGTGANGSSACEGGTLLDGPGAAGMAAEAGALSQYDAEANRQEMVLLAMQWVQNKQLQFPVQPLPGLLDTVQQLLTHYASHIVQAQQEVQQVQQEVAKQEAAEYDGGVLVHNALPPVVPEAVGAELVLEVAEAAAAAAAAGCESSLQEGSALMSMCSTAGGDADVADADDDVCASLPPSHSLAGTAAAACGGGRCKVSGGGGEDGVGGSVASWSMLDAEEDMQSGEVQLDEEGSEPGASA